MEICKAISTGVRVMWSAGAPINTCNVTGIGLHGASPIDAPKVGDPVPTPAQPYQLH
jgi:hypothetical protein